MVDKLDFSVFPARRVFFFKRDITVKQIKEGDCPINVILGLDWACYRVERLQGWNMSKVKNLYQLCF